MSTWHHLLPNMWHNFVLLMAIIPNTPTIHNNMITQHVTERNLLEKHVSSKTNKTVFTSVAQPQMCYCCWDSSFWDLTPFRLVNNNILSDQSPFIFRSSSPRKALNCLTLKIKVLWSFKMSVNTYQSHWYWTANGLYKCIFIFIDLLNNYVNIRNCKQSQNSQTVQSSH
jgi:hypothetical protein